MEAATKKAVPLWRKLILMIPSGVIAFCWLFYFASGICVDGGIEDLFRAVGRVLHFCGWAVMAGSAALTAALIPIIFIRPLSGGTAAKALRVLARCLLFLASAAVILIQCFAGIMCFWGLGY